jgi:hypothetical protein
MIIGQPCSHAIEMNLAKGRWKLLLFTLAWAIVSSLKVSGQNKAYEKDGKVEDFSASDITPETISGKKTDNPNANYSLGTSKVLFLFNDVGNFLVIPSPSEIKSPKYQALINDYFISNSPAYAVSDRIISVQGNVITCNYRSENDTSLSFAIGNKDSTMRKASIALIIFKEGNHKLLQDINSVYNILGLVQNLGNPVDKASQNILPKDANQFATTASAPAADKHAASDSTKADGAGKLLDPVTGLATDKPLPPMKANISPDSAVAGKIMNHDSASNARPKTFAKDSSEKDGLDVDIKEYQDKAIEKVDEFTTYVKLISGKIDDIDEINKYIDRGVKLFINEDAIIEVSRLNRATVNHFLIRQYLERLKQLKYGSVDVKSGNFVVVQNLVKNPDGTYSGIISFEQTFTGKKGDNRVYSDKTKKNMNIILKQYSTSVEGKTVTGWDVFLSDLQVVVTKGL